MLSKKFFGWKEGERGGRRLIFTRKKTVKKFQNFFKNFYSGKHPLFKYQCRDLTQK